MAAQRTDGDTTPQEGESSALARRSADNGSQTARGRSDEAAAELTRRPLSVGPRLRPEHMPGSFDVSVASLGGVERILFGPRAERRYSMRGFEDTYVDIVDYIVRITHRIWEEKDLGYIYDTYATSARVTGGGGLKADREQMVVESIAAMNAFPDARLYADDVIWAGDDEVGFHTSHRVLTVAHNTGWSEFGPPTGRRVVTWSVANCVAAANEIFEEWVLDNTGAVVVQLGLDLLETARATATANDVTTLPGLVSGEVERLQGQGKPVRLPVPDDEAFDPDAFVRYVLHTLWNWRNLAVVDTAYVSGARFHGPTGRELYGRGDIKGYALALLTMFPDLAHSVDEAYWMGNDADGFAVSVRWSMVGTHRGPGAYGPPTGRRAYAWGVSQLMIRHGQITDEWTMWNEFEVLQQLLRLDSPSPIDV